MLLVEKLEKLKEGMKLWWWYWKPLLRFFQGPGLDVAEESCYFW